jgi:purine-nucleoside phosphorylase
VLFHIDFGIDELNARIPAYFQLDKYNISPEDVVQGTLHCEPSVIHSRVIVAPFWKAEVFAEVADKVTEIAPGSVYQLKYREQQFSLIRSGIGASQTGDVILALGCTPCDRVIFTGSVGGLGKGIQIGDLVVVEKSLCGDGFSRYLDTKVIPSDYFLQSVEPNLDLTEHVRKHATETTRNRSVPLHQGVIFSTDSIMAQFFRLEYFVEELHCIGIEMETAAVFRAAELVGIRAGALLQVSDVPLLNRSIYSGRTRQEMERRASIRREVLARIVLDSLFAL